MSLLNLRRFSLSLSCALLLSGCEDPGGPSRDRGAPEIRLLSPLVRDTSVQLTEIGLVGEIYDSVGVARVTYQNNDGPEVESPITPGSTVRFTASEGFRAPLQSGSNTIWLRAYDEAGNRAEQLVYDNVVSDTVDPRLVLLTEDTTVREARLALQGVATDNDRVRRILYRINGGAGLDELSAEAGGEFGLDIPLVPGENLVQLYARDVAGNTSAEVRLTIERQQELTAASLQSVSVGGSANCGLAATGLAYCWGSNQFDVLGPGFEDLPSSPIPVRLEGVTAVRAVSAGMNGACVISDDQSARCWGSNTYGELGRGTLGMAQSSNPERLSGEDAFVQLSVGDAHTCGVSTTGEAICWGDNASGQLGAPTTESCERYGADPTSCSTVPVAVEGGHRFTEVSAGESHTCAVTTEAVAYCWGNNSAGELGDGSTVSSRLPVAVAGEIEWRSVSASWGYSCGVSLEGEAYCWGGNLRGQLGDGTTTTRTSPTPVVGGLRFQAVGTGTSHACGLGPDGAAYCWGEGPYLGSGTEASSLAPAPVAGGLTFRSLDVGHRLACGVTNADAVHCWGQNFAGNIGDGTTGGVATAPRRVLWAEP